MRRNGDGTDDEGQGDAKGLITDLSMRQLLAGFFDRCGGAAKTGGILADIFMDEENNNTLRVRVADIATRLLGQHVSDDSGAGLGSEEEIEEEERRIRGAQ
jgi:hypothetical protein